VVLPPFCKVNVMASGVLADMKLTGAETMVKFSRGTLTMTMVFDTCVEAISCVPALAYATATVVTIFLVTSDAFTVYASVQVTVAEGANVDVAGQVGITPRLNSLTKKGALNVILPVLVMT
jgi:hypothetical protein